MQLKDALGKPGEGFHTHMWGFAVFDFMATVALGALFAWYYGLGWKGYPLSFLVLFFIGQVIHVCLGVETAFLKLLYGPFKYPQD